MTRNPTPTHKAKLALPMYYNDEGEIRDANLRLIASTGHQTSIKMQPWELDAARQIVRAVNAHDALVAALREFNEHFRPLYTRGNDADRAVLDKVIAALALAEKEA